MTYNKGDKMSSIEALKRIKRKYKYLIVKEIHRLTSNSNINIGNIEEYWHKENNDDFSKITKDLEILEILKNNTIIIKDKEEFNKVKNWLEENDLQ